MAQNVDEFISELKEKYNFQVFWDFMNSEESISQFKEQTRDWPVKPSYTAIEAPSKALDRASQIYNEILLCIKDTQFYADRKVKVILLPTVELDANTLISPDKKEIFVLDILLISILKTFTTECIKFMQSIVTEDNVRESIKDFLNITSICAKSLLRDENALKLFPVIWEHQRDYPFGIGNEGHLLGEAIAIFILSHEHAHLIHNHFGDKVDHEVIKDKHQTPLAFFKRKQEEELQADETALKIMLLCAKSDASFVPFTSLFDYIYAPLLFFDLIYLFSLFKNNAQTKYRFHPTAMERKKNLLDFMNNENILVNENSNRQYKLLQQGLSVFHDSIVDYKDIQ